MIIQSKRVWVVNTWLAAQIEVEEGKIVNIYPYGQKDVDEDYGDKRIIPGFIDVHTHGAYGFDTNDANEEGLRNWMKNIVKEGVTGILPTTITQSEEVLTNAVKNVAKVVEEGYEGAEILGIHFEGPYLDQVYKGAQPEQYCVKPDVEQFKRYLAASNNLIKIVTAGKAFNIFGIAMPLVNYSSTVIPIILSVWVMSYLERFFKRYVPESISTIVIPTSTIAMRML